MGKKLQEDIQNAFSMMRYNEKSKMPLIAVLERHPGQEKTKKCCPQELWDVFKRYGGFYHATHNTKGITRNSLVYQLRIFKKGLKKASEQNPLSLMSNVDAPTLLFYVQEALDEIVPANKTLIKEARTKQIQMATVLFVRPRLRGVNIWNLLFWKDHREFLITHYASAFNGTSDNFARTRHFIMEDSHQRTLLYEALKTKYPTFSKDCTNSTCTSNYPVPKCTCLGCLVMDSIDIFHSIFEKYIDNENSNTWKTPPAEATLATQTKIATYNVAGFILRKFQQEAINTCATNESRRVTFFAFHECHSIGRKQAEENGLQYTTKVTFTAKKANTLHYSSETFHELCNRLELLCSYNLGFNYDIKSCDMMLQFVSFAAKDNILLCHWKKCVQETITKAPRKPGAEMFFFKQNETETVLDTIITNYMHMRGREISKTYNNNSQWAGHTRTSGTRNRLASIGAFKRMEQSRK